MKDQDHDYDRAPGIAQALRLVLKPYCYMVSLDLRLHFPQPMYYTYASSALKERHTKNSSQPTSQLDHLVSGLVPASRYFLLLMVAFHSLHPLALVGELWSFLSSLVGI